MVDATVELGIISPAVSHRSLVSHFNAVQKEYADA
jgi:hypothetical protein